MMRFAASLLLAGAASAVHPRVNPSSTTPVDPTPTYSSTMTVRSTYYPSQTDVPGAIHVNKVTSTRTFNPTTFAPDASAACNGGVFMWTFDGEYDTPLAVGFQIAKIARLSHTEITDYAVYGAEFNPKTSETVVTALVCNKKAFDQTVDSMNKAPQLWVLGVSATCSKVMYADGTSRTICSQCPVGEYLLHTTMGCYPCTSIEGCNGTAVCSNANDSTCDTTCQDGSAMAYCKDYQTVCVDGKLTCTEGFCVTYAYRNADGVCQLCSTEGVDFCKTNGNICEDPNGDNPRCGAGQCFDGYYNIPVSVDDNSGPCTECPTVDGCDQADVRCTNKDNACCTTDPTCSPTK